MILAGDIGGTHTRLALFASGAAPTAERVFANRDFGDFAAALGRFLDDAGRPRVAAAAIAAAGPVLAGRIRMTNLAWTLDEVELGRALGAPVRVLNDLEAAAYGVAALTPADLRTLAPGNPGARGNVAVIAAGTGLGKAILTYAGDVSIAIASEGGHVDFAARDETEVALLQWLSRSYGHASAERVVSGPGIMNVFSFLRDTGRAEVPAPLAERLSAAVEPSTVVTAAALAGEFPICVRTLEIFSGAYGAEAGNLALTVLALGGVYVAGGIAPSVLQGRFADRFVAAFTAKGRYEELLRGIPVHVVLSEMASRVGARAIAERLAAA